MIAALLLACSTPSPEAEPAPVPAETQAKAPAEVRIVTIGAAITEIALKLAPGSVVGIDAASAQLSPDLPDVGHSRAISAEGVLSLTPTLVLIHDAAGPDEVITQLEGAVKLQRVTHERTVAGVRGLIEEVGGIVHADPAELVTTFEASCKSLPTEAPTQSALFVYARGGGTMNVSGTGTGADAMFGLAGLKNAVTGYEGYKPLTPEAAVAADPDWVVFTTRGLEALGGVEGVKAVPGLAQLPAVTQGRVTHIDDFDLLAFGLGTCTGARALADATTP